YDHIGVYALEEDLVESSLLYRTLAKLLSWEERDVLRIANHPGWLEGDHHALTTLMRFASSLDGIEIYNYSIEADPGLADTTWKWDCLLSMGYPLLGFAHDDSHSPADIGNAWIMVRAVNASPQEIFKSLKSGNFYCSTGVTITEMERVEDTLHIALAEDAIIRVIGTFGRVLDEFSGKAMEWNFADASTEYVRFHIRNSAWKQGWSQPFFKEPQL
ncbi:MAG: PHP-associated domain-containing protein, partial [Desulfopila sp.]|nr:PHP-associated domain-containing protein [Desulfopila sp.]